jgi:uncharacterized Zn finger protein
MARRRRHSDWGDYSSNYPKSSPIHVEGGMKTRSEWGAIGETWWSKRWVDVLESFGMGTRLIRGRSYARQGQVLSIEIMAGQVKAQVQGSSPQPYKVKIQLKPLSDEDWDEVTDVMAEQALFAAKLLAGEMPRNIEEAFAEVSLTLFPASEADLRTNCSCPDWANPCKHIAAVYYILAERFDQDPFLIFKLRGRAKEEIIAMLREKRNAEVESTGEQEVGVESADGEERGGERYMQRRDYLRTFWQAGEGLDTFSVNPQPPQVDKAVLKRLGRAPFLVNGHNVSDLLGVAYDVVGKAAWRSIEEEAERDSGEGNLK